MFSPPLSLLEEPLATIYSSRPNSNFGYALLLADLNNDGSDDLVIGAPDYFRDEVSTSKVKGCVFVVFGSAGDDDDFKSGNVEDVKDHKICDDTYTYSKFGHAVEALDSDGDGVTDLLVGAPSAGGVDGLNYHGDVFTVKGTLNGSVWRPGTPARVTNGTPSSGVNGNLGWALAVDPGTRNYVASARHFSSFSSRQAGAVLDLADSRWRVEGSARYEWFGSALAFLNGGILAVGSPTWTDGSVRSPGRVSFYNTSDLSAVTTIINGTLADQELGHSLAAGTLRIDGQDVDVLAVGAPTEGGGDIWNRHRGAVRVYRQSDYELVHVIEGPKPGSRFKVARWL